MVLVHTKVQKKKGINYDDPAGILYIRETPRQYEILVYTLHIESCCVYFTAGRRIVCVLTEPRTFRYLNLVYIMVDCESHML